MHTLSRYDAVYKKAVNEWETASGRNFDAVVNDMLSSALIFLEQKQKHFHREILKLNESEFRLSMRECFCVSLSSFVMSTTNSGKIETQRKQESWAYTSSLLLKMRDLYRQIPESRRDLINAYLESQQCGQLPDDLCTTLMQARLVCSNRGVKRETRGRKTSPLTILVVALAENIEETFGRTLSRSYDTAPDNLFANSAMVFTNHDVNLIYLISRLLIPEATVEKVKAAMKNNFSRGHES